MSRARSIASWLWWAVVAGTVIGSLTPRSDSALAQFRDSHDRVLHMACYAALTGLQAFESTRRRAITFGLALLAGVAIECIQPFVGRAFDWADVFDNTAGLVLGVITATVLREQWMPG